MGYGLIFLKGMIMELKLTSTIPPSVNHYLSYRAVMKNGRPMAMSYKTPEAVRYQKEFAKYVSKEVFNQGWCLIPNKTQHFYVDTVFYFDRIDRDCNNYFKVMLDAITDTQMIWLDDNVVCERVQRIYYDSNNPRIELTIYPVDYIGVFDNASQMEDFTSICVGCTRYSNNCTILQKAKSGKIQSEIANGLCSKYNAIKKQSKERKG